MKKFLLALILFVPTGWVCAQKGKQQNDFQIPAWYKANRIHFHWEGWYPGKDALTGGGRTYNQWLNQTLSSHDIIARSGAKATVAVTRHSAEGNWKEEEKSDKIMFYNYDIIKNDIIGDYAIRGVKVLAYHRHDMDMNIQNQHPEWLCRNADGSPVAKNRGVNYYNDYLPFQICCNSPYREFMRDCLAQVAELGAYGLYFDQDHMPEVCYCDNCKKKFKKLYGYEMPVHAKPGSKEYFMMTQFVGNSLSEVFNEWKAAAQKKNPECVLLVSAEKYTQFTGLHQNEEMVMSSSAVKSEFQKCFGGQQHAMHMDPRKMLKANPDYYNPKSDIKEALEKIVGRDSKRGVPPHIWICKPDPDVYGEFMHTTTAVVAYGAIASLVAPAQEKYLPLLKKVYSLNSNLAPFMEQAEPYNWAVIYVSRDVRDKIYVEGGERNNDKIYKDLFEGFYAPILGVAQSFEEQRYPYGIITDDILEKGDLSQFTKVVVVPYESKLTEEAKSRLELLQKKGIKVVWLDRTLGKNSCWYIAKENDLLREKFKNEFIKQAGLPPIYGMGADGARMTVQFNPKTNKALVSVVRNWDWFFFFAEHKSTWKIDSPIPELTIVTSLPLKSARMIDFDGSSQLANKLEVMGGSVKLSPFDIYNFIELCLN